MTGEMRFRRANHGDVEAIVALVQSAYRGDESRGGWTTEVDIIEGQRTDAADIAETLERDSSLVLLAEQPDLVACCNVRLAEPRVGYFGLFAVRPALQGRGVGRVVMAEAERIAVAELGCVEMMMTVIAQRSELIAWYERAGYVRTGDTHPFPYGQDRFGVPKRDDLVFVELRKSLA